MQQYRNPLGMYFKAKKRINYAVVIKLIFSQWYWLLSSIAIGYIIGHCYLAYIPKLYETHALLKFEERKSEISELINIRNVYDRTNKVESEKSVIRSRAVVEKAILALDYKVSFYSKTKFRSIELYPYKPFTVNIKEKSKLQIYDNFDFTALSHYRYQLCYNYQNKQLCNEYNYGQLVSLPGLTFSISASKELKIGMSYLFKLNDQSELVNRITKSLKLDEAQNINLLYLKLTDHNPYFAVDILNAILKEYLNFDKSQRSATALQTANFISSLLQTMADTVSKSGLAIQKFRQDNKASTIPNNIDVLTDRLSDLQSEKETIDINHLLISSIEKSLNTLNTNQLIYNLESITDTQLSNLLIKYNELVIYRKRSLDTYTENSAIVKQLDRQIVDFRDAISDNIFSQRNRNNIKATYITKQIDSINMSLADVPKVEREFVNLQASFDINQKVYSYLGQKKLEAEISGAAVTPGAVIIDKAVFPEKAIAPIPKTVYTLSILASLMSMVIIIYFVRTFNPYIYGKGEIEDASHTPIIGIIRKYRGDSLNKHSAITTDPRSLFSESVRSVRSNLGFFGSEAACKTICIISEISGEGKSFISTNLAISMTLTEKKVLLIAADLRKSKLHDNFQVGNVNGLSKFLSGQSSADEIVVHTEIKNLDLIPSGPVPPNPSELLHSQRMQQLLDNFKGKYDYILIDSAPVGLVTDGKPLLKMADITLFILRSGVSKRFFASTPDQLKTEMNLSNIAIILNDFEERKFYSDYYANAQLNITHRSYYHPSLGKYNYEDYLEL